MHVDAAEPIGILAPLDRIDIAIVQFRLAAEVERPRVARADGISKSPTGVTVTMPRARVSHTEHATCVIASETFAAAPASIV